MYTKEKWVKNIVKKCIYRKMLQLDTKDKVMKYTHKKMSVTN